ncbi:hypothetical protein GOODEAATRI_033844 [Goodea atripinnis]|uniref:Uncharacterized protein n=1 Tax=Goodea atripinnis TaxID=208336 RepID=A0ABV0MMY0_9TELE
MWTRFKRNIPLLPRHVIGQKGSKELPPPWGEMFDFMLRKYGPKSIKCIKLTKYNQRIKRQVSPAVIGQEMGYTLDRFPVHHWTTQRRSNWREPMHAGRTANSKQKDPRHGFEPKTFLLQSNCVTTCATVLPGPTFHTSTCNIQTPIQLRLEQFITCINDYVLINHSPTDNN